MSCRGMGPLASNAPNDNIERYHGAAIEIHEAECAIDTIAPYDDLDRFRPLFASRLSASSAVPDDPIVSEVYDECFSPSLSTALSQFVRLLRILKIVMSLYMTSSESKLLHLGKSIQLRLKSTLLLAE